MFFFAVHNTFCEPSTNLGWTGKIKRCLCSTKPAAAFTERFAFCICTLNRKLDMKKETETQTLMGLVHLI